MLKRQCLYLLGLISFCVDAGMADEIVELEPLSVTGYPIIEQSQIRENGKIDVVSESILETLNAGDLTAALRRVPGVTISRYNPVGAFGGSDGGGVFIRGHGSGRPGADISTMIDGIPLFVGVWTHPLIDTLSVDIAESIEVMKSPQPVMVGNMGFGAVNIVPKIPMITGHQRALEGSYGHHDTAMIRGRYAYSNERFGVMLSGSHRQSEGHRENADGEVDALYGNFSYAWSDSWTASLLISVTDSWAHDPEPVGLPIPIVERYNTRNRFYLGKLNYQGDDSSFELKLHAEDGEGDWMQWHQAPPPPFPSQSLDTLTEYDNYGIKAKWLQEAGHIGKWTVGLDWDRIGGSATETYEYGAVNVFDDEHFELLAPYAMWSETLEWSNRQLEINGGVRYTHHSVFDSEWAGQVGIQLRGPLFTTYFNYANSVNFPGVYVSVFGRRPPPWNVGDTWQSLDSERIEHLELGAQVTMNDSLSLDFSLFKDNVEHKLTLVTPPPAGYIYNLGSYTIDGAELLLHYHTSFWSAFAGVTWLDSEEDIPNAPEWSGTVGLSGKKNRWSFSTDLQMVSEQLVLNPRFNEAAREVDGYELLSARIAYRIDSDDSYWECYLHGENLLNRPYEYRPGYPMPGITLTLGIKREW